MTDAEARYARIVEAWRIMLEFAERTDVATGNAPKRYLWTDAFAVATLLGLARATGDDRFTKLALRLVGEVHRVLGRYRADDSRRGWLGGSDEEEAHRHPTRGGLRIGKSLPERGERDRFDEGMEWDRDGQYFHYLTQWMHALDLVARTTRDLTFNRWGRELGETAHAAFVYGSPTHGRRRMFWKMSTDLSRPLVPSMGHHDPIEGFAAYSELRATSLTLDAADRAPNLVRPIEDFRGMIRPSDLSTPDPLSIGGLLLDAYRLIRLTALGTMRDPALLDALLGAALEGLFAHAVRHDYEASPSERLAFRELGLAIGLRAVELMEAEVDAAPKQFAASNTIRSRLQGLVRYVSLGWTTASFWRRAENRSHLAWQEHRDINEVMLATCLAPNGYLLDADDEARLGIRHDA